MSAAKAWAPTISAAVAPQRPKLTKGRQLSRLILVWWLPIDPDDTQLDRGELVDLDWFVRLGAVSLPLDREYRLDVGQELWLYERPFRRVAGLAHVVRTAYRQRSHWWVELELDQVATRALRRRPLRCEDKVMRREPWRYGEADPWLVDMHPGDLLIVQEHLAKVRHARRPPGQSSQG